MPVQLTSAQGWVLGGNPTELSQPVCQLPTATLFKQGKAVFSIYKTASYLQLLAVVCLKPQYMFHYACSVSKGLNSGCDF